MLVLATSIHFTLALKSNLNLVPSNHLLTFYFKGICGLDSDILSQGVDGPLPHGSALGVDFASVIICAAPGVAIQINQDGQTMWLLGQISPTTCFCKLHLIGTATSFRYILFMIPLMLQWQNWVAATETVWPPKQRIFVIWSFIEKVCQALIWVWG